MSSGRSRSLPLVDAGVAVNPFWSERVVGDIRLQQHRPRELPPVPDGSVETRSRSGSARRGTQPGTGKGVGVPGQGAPLMPGRQRSWSFGRKEGRGSGSTGQKTFRLRARASTRRVEKQLDSVNPGAGSSRERARKRSF